MNNLADLGWVPSSCTLPTVEQPLRSAEFDSLFRDDVLRVEMPSPKEVHLELRANRGVAARAADLASRETGCCSFFSFDLSIGNDALLFRIGAQSPHEDVLAALHDRAARLHGADQ